VKPRLTVWVLEDLLLACREANARLFDHMAEEPTLETRRALEQKAERVRRAHEWLLAMRAHRGAL